MHQAFYDSPEWRSLRERVVERDGSVCTVGWLLGGACSHNLHVHHIESVEDRPDLALEEDNCATTCSVHHPKWEALRRALNESRRPLPPCNHRHPYIEGKKACERRRMREAGYLVPA